MTLTLIKMTAIFNEITLTKMIPHITPILEHDMESHEYDTYKNGTLIIK